MMKLSEKQVEALARHLINEAQEKRNVDYAKIKNLKIIEERAHTDYSRIKELWSSISDVAKQELDLVGEITYAQIKAAHINNMSEELPAIPRLEHVCHMIYRLSITSKTLEEITSQINLYNSES
jgi:hypothetical protein